MKQVVHLCLGLGKGGAETMLFNILKYSKDIEYIVISLNVTNYYEEEIRNLGIDLRVYDIKKYPIQSLFNSIKIIRKANLLCCWMYHANLIGFFLGKLARVKKIVWCIRHSNLDENLNKNLTIKIAKICGKFSKKISCILYNGKNARIVHEKIGYSKNNGKVVINGCDLEKYKYDMNAENNLKNELGISYNTKIILSVSRYHPIKDIPTYLKAFIEIKKEINDIAAVMCGKDIDCDNSKLLHYINDLGLIINKDIYLLGIREDLSTLFSAGDLYILHSASEAFPNTLIEAIACEIPVLATDVGSVKEVLEDNSLIVNPGDYISLAIKSIELLIMDFMDRKKIYENLIVKVKKEYSIEQVVKSYEDIFKKI